MRRLIFCLLIFSAVALVASLGLAASSELRMPWSAIEGGGGNSGDGEQFTLTGSMGLAAAGHAEDGSRFEMESGFLSGKTAQETRWILYLPLVEQR